MAGKKRTSKQKKSSSGKKKTHNSSVAGLKNPATVASVDEEQVDAVAQIHDDNDVAGQPGPSKKNAVISKDAEKGIVAIRKPGGAIPKKYTVDSLKIKQVSAKQSKIPPYISTANLPIMMDCSPRTVTYGMCGKPCWGKFPDYISKAFLIIEPTNDVFMLRPHDVFKRMEILGNLIEKMVGDLQYPADSNNELYLRNMCILKCEGMWLRAACSEVKKDRIYCYLLDGGFFTWATYANMLPMTQKMIDLLPFQALECELGGITRTVALTEVRHVIYQFLDCETGMCYAVHEPDRPTGSMGGPTYHINLLNKYGMSLNQFFLEANFANAVPQCERFHRDAYILDRHCVETCKEDKKKWHFVKITDTVNIGTNTDPVIMVDVSTSTYGISTADASTATNLVTTADASTATQRVVTMDASTCTDPVVTINSSTTTDEFLITNIVLTAGVSTSTIPARTADAETCTDFEAEYDIYEEDVKAGATAEAGTSTGIIYSDKETECDEFLTEEFDDLTVGNLVKASTTAADFRGTDAATVTSIAAGAETVLSSLSAALMTCV